MMSNYIVRTEKGKVIGDIKDNVFKKTVQESRHLFRSIPSYALDTQILNELEQLGVATIVIYDKENKKTYTSSLINFKTNCFEAEFGNNGPQSFLPLKFFTIEQK